MATSLKDAVEKSFLAVHMGRSTDDVVIEPVLNKAFLSECKKLAPNASDFDENWQLFNLRKASSLGKVTTDVRRFSHGDYQHASQIAARQLEDRFQLTVDRILCDPAKRDEFDVIASSVAEDVPVYQLRKAALGLRKARKLRPELIKRIADWGVKILSLEAKELADDGNLIPRKPGIYLFRDKSGYLYIGEASSLRSRVSKSSTFQFLALFHCDKSVPSNKIVASDGESVFVSPGVHQVSLVFRSISITALQRVIYLWIFISVRSASIRSSETCPHGKMKRR